MKLTIGQRILLGYGATLLCMALIAIAAYWSTGILLAANGLVRHTFLVMGNAEGIRANLVEIESASRGYVMTGDERYLEPIEGSRTRLAENRKMLRALTADNSAQERRLDAVDPLIDRRLSDLIHISSGPRIRNGVSCWERTPMW